LKKAFLVVPLTVVILLPSIALSTAQPGPGADMFQYLRVSDLSAAFAALLAGELDVTILTAKPDLVAAREAGLKIVEAPSYLLYMHHFNMHRDIINDLEFRRAVAHLIPKEALLEEYLGTLGEYEHNFITNAGVWYNTETPDATFYDPELAAFILDQAGYTMGTDGWRIDPATGETMREIQLVTIPEYPAEFLPFIEQLEIEMENIGIPARLEYVAWTGGVWYVKTIIQRDFDIFYINVAPGADGQSLYYLYASFAPLPIAGYSNAEFDEQYFIYANTLDETEAIEAMWKMQELLVNDLPGIPCFHLRVAAALHPDITGVFGWEQYGRPSMNAFLRWRWKAGGGNIRIGNIDEPGSFIHGFDVAGIVATYTWWTCDALLDSNPLTKEIEPWIATDWELEPWSDPGLGVTQGSKLTLWIEDNVYWHDGVKFTAYDIEFALRYAKDNGIPKVAARDFVDISLISENQIELYFNKTSLFTVAALWDPELLSYPKHLYNPNASIYGEPEGPIGLQEEGKPGVPDPSTFAAPFVAHPDPPVDKPWLTCFIGVGPWIFKSYEWGVGSTFVANRDYFLTILVSDTNFDRSVNILDISQTAKAFGTTPDDPRWDLTVDINGDDIINILDIATIALDFGNSY